MKPSPDEQLAQILVNYSVAVKKGEKVVITASPQGMPLARQVYRLCLQKGAYPHLNFSPEDLDFLFYRYASLTHLKRKPEVALFLARWADKFIRIVTDLNPRQLASVPPRKITLRTKAYEPVKKIMLSKKWVLTYYPTHSLAQTAGLSLEELREIYFKACLQDWKKIKKQLLKIKSLLDNAPKVEVKGEKTHLTFSLTGRFACAAAGEYNMPDGEVFAAPNEDSVEGEIFFDLPSLYQGKIVEKVFLVFKKGQVVKATAERGEEVLKAALATDAGARRLGEFALGANFGISRVMLNTLFDEKIGGTIHLALGNAYPEKEGGGRNHSAIHWDLVKDMRKKGSLVSVNGRPLLKEGRFLL